MVVLKRGRKSLSRTKGTCHLGAPRDTVGGRVHATGGLQKENSHVDPPHVEFISGNAYVPYNNVGSANSLGPAP